MSAPSWMEFLNFQSRISGRVADAVAVGPTLGEQAERSCCDGTGLPMSPGEWGSREAEAGDLLSRCLLNRHRMYHEFEEATGWLVYKPEHVDWQEPVTPVLK